MMKKIFFYTCTILFLCLSKSVYSQKLEPKEVKSKLVKEWTATEVGNPGEEMLPKENTEILNFKANGSLQMVQESKMMGSMTVDAKWLFDKKKQRIIMTLEINDKKESQSLEIIELTNSRLVLASDNKQTAYIPSDMAVEKKAPIKTVASPTNITSKAFDPTSWSGQLQYNIVFKGDDNADVEEKRSGVIILNLENDKKSISKKENGESITWTITGDMEMAGITRYTAECSDVTLSGEISFQNGGMMVEIYEPKYLSLFYLSQ